MRCIACSLLAFVAAAEALSSHSPQDLYAYPKYSVHLSDWESAINNATAQSELSLGHQDMPEPLAKSDDLILASDRQEGSDPTSPQHRKRLMRSASGQAFLCSVPPIPARESRAVAAHAGPGPARLTDKEKAQRDRERAKRREDGLRKGLALLEPMRNQCIFTRLGWFTYSFCYGTGEIRQFHGVIAPGQARPLEDPKQDVYTLGYHVSQPSHPHYQDRLDGRTPSRSASKAAGELTEYGRGLGVSGVALSEVLREESLGGLAAASSVNGVDANDAKHYITQRWGGGTICDLTGRPRSVEVQFHCSTTGTDHIALLREVAICEYLIVVHTPRLCAEPLFLDGAGKDPQRDAGEAIVCKPIVDQAVLDRREVQRQHADDGFPRFIEEQPTHEAATTQPAAAAEAPATPPSTDTAAVADGGATQQAGRSDSSFDVQLVFDPSTGQLYIQDQAQGGTESATDEAAGQAQTEPEAAAASEEGTDALQELTRMLRDSFEGLLKDLRDTAGDNAAQQRQPLQQAEAQQPLTLQEILAKLVDSGAGTVEGQPAQQQTGQDTGRDRQQGRGGSSRKRAQPFPAQAGQARQGGATAAMHLLQAAQQGRLPANLGGRPGTPGTSQEHDRLAKLYAKSFGEGGGDADGEKKERQRTEL